MAGSLCLASCMYLFPDLHAYGELQVEGVRASGCGQRNTIIQVTASLLAVWHTTQLCYSLAATLLA